MRHITYTYAKGTQGHDKAPKLVPILLYLRKLKEVIATKQPTLPELITDYYLKDLLKGKDLAIPPNWARNILKLGKALILFDGFDEVDQKWRDVVSQWIADQMQYYDKSVFILTSRPRGYDGYTAEKPKTQLRVLQFNSQQRKEFITKWYFAQENMFPNRDRKLAKDAADRGSISLIDQIEQQPELATMARIPLLLNMIAFYHRQSRSGQELPTYRAGLYEEICNVQLIKRADLRLPEFPLYPLERQQVLQSLALWMMEQNLERLEKEQLFQILQPKVKAFDESVDVKDFVNAIAEVSELLVEAEKDEYEFAHLTFQAFLAAAEILRLKQEDFLAEQWQDDWWKDTMLFYTGLVKNPSSFLLKLLNKGEEAVSLAGACRKNTSKKIDPSIEVQLRNTVDTQIGKLRYEKLEGFLKNGQWREADDETFRVMLEVVGKEKDDYFTREELLNFPCDDLLKIDKLWLEYSKINGVSKFGFSLQKEIIKKCGYKLDGSNPPSKVWYDFLDEVGWGKKTIYILDINTKIGTLPKKIWGGWVMGGENIFSSLASRLVDCSR